MKKVILGSVLAIAAAASMEAGAVTVCSGGGGTSAQVSVGGGTDIFIKAGFTARCSNNVALAYDETATYMRVGSVSVKGRNMFAGSSVGGAVTGTPCTGTGGVCASGDAAGALTNAPTS